MDNLITLTATITYPVTEIEKFSDNRGYQTVIANPDVTTSVDTETGVITTIGELTIPNPETRIDFVKRWFKDQAVALFVVDYKKEAKKQGMEIAKQIEASAEEQLAQAINIS